MLDLIRIFLTGVLISFLGSLPLGSLNISAMQIAVQESIKNAVKFALGVTLVEILYVRLSLKGLHWVLENKTIFRALEWATVVLFLVLAISSFYTAWKNKGSQKNIMLNNKMNRFFLGFTMSAINPVQIPFWVFWSTWLMSNKYLRDSEIDYNVYTAGIGIGTLIGLFIFIFGGKKLIEKANTGNKVINIVAGIVFLVSAAFQLYRVLSKPFMG